MSKLHTGVLTAVAVAAFLFGLDQACAAAGTDTQQQAAPQGKDGPGADDNGQAPLAQRTESSSRPRPATRASTLKSPILMPDLVMRFPRRPKCPAVRTQNRNRCGRERSESVRVAFGTNEGEQDARPAPGQDATAPRRLGFRRRHNALLYRIVADAWLGFG
jgi:hypothetical protein